MAQSKAHVRASGKYNKENYDILTVPVPKGDKEKIRSAAEAAGKSVSEYIRNAVYKQMEQESDPLAVPDDALESVTGGTVTPGSDWDTEDYPAKYIN